MKILNTIMEWIRQQKLRIVLASILSLSLVLSFVVLYQKDNEEEAYAAEEIIQAKDLPVNTTVYMGEYYTKTGTPNITWKVLTNDDHDGDGITEPLLISTKAIDHKINNGYGNIYNLLTPLSSLSVDTAGQYQGLRSRWASSVTRYKYNTKKNYIWFITGSAYNPNYQQGNWTYLLSDYEWNALKLSKIRTVVSNKQADLGMYEGGTEYHTVDTDNAANFIANANTTAYYEYSYDKLFEIGYEEMPFYNLYDLKRSYSGGTVGCFLRDAYASTTNAYRGYFYDYNNNKPIANYGGYNDNSYLATACFACYLKSDALVRYNGSTGYIYTENYFDDINYAKSVTTFPDESKLLTKPGKDEYVGNLISGRIDNFGNAIITERGWYLGYDAFNQDNRNLVAVTEHPDGSDTIVNTAVKVVYDGFINDEDYYEKMIDFTEYFPDFVKGDTVWVRAYVKSKLSPGGEEREDIGVCLKVRPEAKSTTSWTDKRITGIKHPSEMIGQPLSSNIPDKSREWSTSITWGDFDGDSFVPKTGNFEEDTDYWVEIVLTPTNGASIYSKQTSLNKFDDSDIIVVGADDYNYHMTANNDTSMTIYGFYKAKPKTSLQVGNTVQMGKFNGHSLTWRVVKLQDLDGDGVEEAPLLVLDNYLMESGSNNPYLRSFSFDGQRGEYPDQNRIDNGSNRYADSAIRRWLNTRNQNMTYANSLHYDDQVITDGFLSPSNFNESEYNSIRQAKIKTLTSFYDGEKLGNKEYGTSRHIYDSDMTDIYANYRNSYYEESYDMVFLMGIEDLAYANAISGNGFNANLGTSYYLRDSRSDTSDEVRTVDSATTVSADKAHSEKAIRPALYLMPNANLTSLGGGAFKIADGNKRAKVPATVTALEMNYSKIDTANSKAYAGAIIENPDNVQILEVGFINRTDSRSTFYKLEDCYGSQRIGSTSFKPTVIQNQYIKDYPEYTYELSWSTSTYVYYYMPYIKSLVDGREIIKYGTVMSYKTGSKSVSNQEIKDLDITGLFPMFDYQRSQAIPHKSGEWTSSVQWYEDGSETGMSTSDRFHLEKPHKAVITLTKGTNYKWGNIPENAFHVQYASRVESTPVTAGQTTPVTVTAYFDPHPFTVYDLKREETIRLGGYDSSYDKFKILRWEDVDDDGVNEALFVLNCSHLYKSSSAFKVNYSINDSYTKTGFDPYFGSSYYSSRWDLSYARKWLNVKTKDINSEVVNTAQMYQNFRSANNYSSATYNYTANNLFQTAFNIKDYEYNSIKVAKWKFLLGKHEIDDLKMPEEWDGYGYGKNISGGHFVNDYYYPNLKNYYAYSYEKFSTIGLKEVYDDLNYNHWYLYGTRVGSSDTNVATRDGYSLSPNYVDYLKFTSSSSGLTYSYNSGNTSMSLRVCFYLEPDVYIGYNKDNYLGITEANEIKKDYAVSITGEPIYAKTPSTLDKIMLTGDCDNLAYANISEKGWYIGYNPNDNMDYSMVDPETIKTTAKKVVYNRDWNMTDGYYDQLVDLKALFPNYQPGDYIWIRSYTKSKYDNMPAKETYGNRIRVNPQYTNATTGTNLDDYYITGILNPAHYVGRPIADYSSYANPIDPSCAWNVKSIKWGRYNGTTFTEVTNGDFRGDAQYSVEVVLEPKSPYKVSSSISSNYFKINGADQSYNASISSGATSITVYGTFPIINLQSRPDAPEASLEKNGTSLVATWTEPDNHRSEITNYVIQLDDNDPETVSAETFTKTYTNVSNSSHIFKVKAVNGVGESDEGIATVVPLYEVPNSEGVAYWEEDLEEYEDRGETKKAIWDISQNNDGSVFAYLFKTKNNLNEYVNGEQTLVFAGNGSNIIDFNYAYTGTGNDFYKQGSDDAVSQSFSGYDYRSSSVIPWSWINRQNTNIKHVVFGSETNFTDWDLLFAGMDNLTDITFNGEGKKTPASMERTFADTSNFAINLSKINTANVVNMKSLFENSKISNLDISSWSSQNLVNIESMLSGLTNASSVTFGENFTCESVDNAEYLFASSSFEKIDLTNAKFGCPLSMASMFQNCSDLKSVKFGSNFDTTFVSNFNYLFDGCESLGLETDGGLTDGVLDLSMFKTSSSTVSALNMFNGCENLKGITFGNFFSMSYVTSTKNMFKGCSSLEELNLSKFELDSVTEYDDMFTGCSKLTKIYIPSSIKQGSTINLPSEGFLPYTSGGLIVSDISDTTHLIAKTLEGPSGINADYVKVASQADLKINAINNASDDEAIYNIIRSQEFKDLIEDDELNEKFSGTSVDTKKLCANYLFNKIHTGGTINPYSSLDLVIEDLMRVIDGGEKIEYESLEILPGEKGTYKVTGLLSNTNEIKVTYNDGTNDITNVITCDTDYETIVVNPSVTYTFTKTVKNSALFTDPITIGSVTFANHLTLADGDITFSGGPFTYNGEAQYVTPACSKYASADFITTYKLKGTNTLIAKSEIINAGTYVCETKISGADFIDGVRSATTEFTIEKLSMTDNSDITLEGYESTVTYNGKAYKPEGLVLKWNGNALSSNDYEIVFGENINVPSGTITANGKNNFQGSKTFTFTISPRNIAGNDDIVSVIPDYEWTGNQLTPTEITVLDNGIKEGTNSKLLVSMQDYLIFGYGPNANIGSSSGQIQIKGLGNYTGQKLVYFNIVGQIISNLNRVTVEVDDTDLYYTGAELTPTNKVTVKLDGNALDTSDYEIVRWENNTNASNNAKVVIKLTNNYSSNEVSKTFTIRQVDFTNNSDVTLENIPTDFVYDGKPKTVTGTLLKWKTNTLTLNTDYSMQVSNNTNAGEDTGVIKITGKGNFTGSKEFNFSIAKRSITDNDSIKALIGDMEWTGSQIKPDNFKVVDEDILVSQKAKELIEDIDFRITGYGTNIAIGENGGSITLEGLGNYNGTKTVNFDIVGQIVRDLSRIKVEIDDSDVIFDGTPKCPSDKIKVKLDDAYLASTEWEVVDGSWSNNTNANEHQGATKAQVKVKLKGNLSSDPVTKEFTIHPKEVDASDFVYSGPVITKLVTTKNEYNNVVPNTEKGKIVVTLNSDTNTKLKFTKAEFAGIDPSDSPKKFGQTDIVLTGLSLDNKNYKLKDTFTSFNIGKANGLLTDKIKPELDSDWVQIPNGLYHAGDKILVTLRFDKKITHSGDDPILEFWSMNKNDGSIGTSQSNKYVAKANFKEVNNNEVTFEYEVKDGDYLPHGFTFKLASVNKFNTLKDELGNEISFETREKIFTDVKIVTPDAVFNDLINEIQGNDSKERKEQVIKDILYDPDKTDVIFEIPRDNDLITKLQDDDLKDYIAEYLSNITLTSDNKKDELIDEMRKAISLKDTEDEIKQTLEKASLTKEELDDAMIKYQKLTENQKKNFDKELKEKLDEKYYGMFTDAYVYEDDSEKDSDRIEVFGIVTKTSAGYSPVKLKVERITEIERINNLQSLVKNNAGGEVENPADEKIIAPYDITLVDETDMPVTISNPSDKVLCRIDIPSSYYGEKLNIYHKKQDDTLEKIQSSFIEKLDDKTAVYFECDSFSPYFMTGPDNSVKTQIDPESTPGSVSPLGLVNKKDNESQVYHFTKSGDTNRVDVILYKYDEDLGKYVEVTGINPINLNKQTTYTLPNIDTNYQITFKFSYDPEFDVKEEPKPEVVNVYTITVGKGTNKAYMEGYKDGTFRPNNYMTRAEAATVIARINPQFNPNANYTSYANGFKDLNKASWSINYIGFVISKGYMCGDKKGFRPNDYITRGEFTKIIYKLKENELKQVSVNIKFTDVNGKFYQDYSNTLYSANLVKGYGGGSFKGQNPITRSEVCSIINDVLGRGKDKNATLDAVKASGNMKTFKDLPEDRWFYFDDIIATVTYMQ